MGASKDTSARVRAKREREERVVTEMIALYCRGNHAAAGNGSAAARGGHAASRGIDALCPECRELADYARTRSEHCPFMETKTFCSNCKVHCYSPEMRERIRAVMRYSGPRMLFHHPAMTVWHVFTSAREKLRARSEKA
jgi:hypothetical protein